MTNNESSKDFRPVSLNIGENNKIPGGMVLNINITEIGDNNIFSPFCSIGQPAEHRDFYNKDSKHFGKFAKVKIGNNNIIREGVTIHAGIFEDTEIGNDCFFMRYSHIAHGCKIGNNVTLAPAVLLMGECRIMDNTTIGGGAAVHQHTTIGECCMVGMNAIITKDIPPFLKVINANQILGLNEVGMQRNGFKHKDIDSLKEHYRQYKYELEDTDGLNKRIIAALESFYKTHNPSRKMAKVNIW